MKPRRRLGAARPRHSHVRVNRSMWERIASEYEQRHGRSLRRAGSASWGLFRIPEEKLRLLGSVKGRSVLELGCGAALWSIALARQGARCTGVDLSRARIRQADVNVRRSGRRIDLAEADAERLPFRDASFDIAFCDWGALTFARPDRTIPEAARVLRAGGRLVFSTASPIRSLFEDRGADRIGRRLRHSYFDLDRIDYRAEVNFQLPYGTWIRLFRSHGLRVEELIEAPVPPRSRSSYLTRGQSAWGRAWPLESIWRLSKEGDPARRRTRSRGTRRVRPTRRIPSGGSSTGHRTRSPQGPD